MIGTEYNVYSAYGCSCRDKYLALLADEFGADLADVIDLAYTLGPDKDFTDLIDELELKYVCSSEE